MVDNGIIDIQSVSLKRRNHIVLDDINVAVNRHEVLVVIGPSGSGKSSLLRCINRLTAIESGTIIFDGEDIHNFPILELRQKIGMVFQKTAAFDGTVAENIAYAPRLQGTLLSEAQILTLMQQAALESDLINRDAKTLSGGQEQRLSIARALANQPQVLLLDEPTSALDPIATHRIEEILLKLREDIGLTLIWVSHSIEQARRVADRVLFLEGGRVVRWGMANAMLDEEHGDPRVLAFANGSE
jgi:putative ABC transport system ATP-binding protein